MDKGYSPFSIRHAIELRPSHSIVANNFLGCEKFRTERIRKSYSKLVNGPLDEWFSEPIALTKTNANLEFGAGNLSQRFVYLFAF